MDIPEAWQRAFNRRLAGHVDEHRGSLEALRALKSRPVDLVGDCLHALVAPATVTAFSRPSRRATEGLLGGAPDEARLALQAPARARAHAEALPRDAVGARVKAGALVTFPVEGLDLSEFLDASATASAEDDEDGGGGGGGDEFERPVYDPAPW